VLENFQISISDQTIRRIFKKYGLKSLSKLKKLKLSVKHVKERENFYQTYKKMISLIGENLFFPMNLNSTCMEQMVIGEYCVKVALN
jgi:hypothetical protein